MHVVVQAGQYHHKLITAQTGYGVALAHAVLQALRYLLQ